MMQWGSHASVTQARADMYKDDTHGKIGFWTDNGDIVITTLATTSR